MFYSIRGKTCSETAVLIFLKMCQYFRSIGEMFLLTQHGIKQFQISIVILQKCKPLCICRPQKFVWHGSDTKGIRNQGKFCAAWRSDSSKDSGMASPLAKQQLLAQQDFACNNVFAVLCVEVSLSSKDSETYFTLVTTVIELSPVFFRI